MSAAAATSTHAELMRAMGSQDGFDPMPPSQHQYLLDREEPMLNRAIAWVWSKTIRPGRGHRRTPFASDERGALTHVHAAADLGWTVSNTRVVFAKLAEQGRIRADAQGRVYLCGNAPAPRLGDEASDDGRIDGETHSQEISTYSLPRHFTQYLQGLSKTEAERRRSEWIEVQKFKKQILADGVARLRALGEEVEEKWLTEIGCANEENRGRPKVERETPTVQLSLLAAPNFVHISAEPNSVQNGAGAFVQKENGSVHISHPYSSENQSFREELAASNSSENEALEEALSETIERSRLVVVGGRKLDARTVRTMRTHLAHLHSPEEIRAVLDVLEDKCRHLAAHRNEAAEKTWGWLVGLVRSEVENRETAIAGTGDLRTQIRTAAAAKGMA